MEFRDAFSGASWARLEPQGGPTDLDFGLHDFTSQRLDSRLQLWSQPWKAALDNPKIRALWRSILSNFNGHLGLYGFNFHDPCYRIDSINFNHLHKYDDNDNKHHDCGARRNTWLPGRIYTGWGFARAWGIGSA